MVSIMDDQNVIIFLDKIKKLLELGNKPKAITEIEAIMEMLTKQITRKNGKLILPIPHPVTESENKLNEIIHFINGRFPV